MNKIILTAESGSDISVKDAAHYGIEIVPMHVIMDGKSYDDGTFPVEQICNYYAETGKTPTTSGSTVDDFVRAFDNIHAQWPDAKIIHLAYSAITTGSFNAARIAAEGRDYITIVDTKHVSAGQQVVVLKAAEMMSEQTNNTVEDIVRYVENLRAKTKMCFLPDDLNYLHAGGRCSNLSLACGKALGIRPCVEVLDGKLTVTQKFRGRLSRVVPKLIQSYTQKNRLKKDCLWLLWSVGLPDEIKVIAENAAYECGYSNLKWIKTGCVITTHGGPGAFGIAGISDEGI